MQAAEEILEALLADDQSGARRILAARRGELDPEDAADFDAVLGDGPQASVPPLDAGLDLVRPHASTPSRPEDPSPVRFRCLMCGGQEHARRRALLNTRWVTFFGFDELNADASLFICRSCSHVHWFVQGHPGALQLSPGNGESAVSANPADACRVCGYGAFWSREAVLNRALLAFLNLDFLGQKAPSRACYRCGHLHWSLGDEGRAWTGPAPAARPGIRCLGCAGDKFALAKGQISERWSAHVGLDWLDETATLLLCEACRALHWFAARPERVEAAAAATP